MIRAYVSEDFVSQRVGIAIVERHSEQRAPARILRLVAADNGAHALRWEELAEHVETEPTLTLEDDAARALLDALTRHYQGAEDTRSLRADYDHERKRVDKLSDAVATLAQTLAGPVSE